MTIACQSATTMVPIIAPIGLTAQSMTITPIVSPCYDPCTVTVAVTWTNDTVGSITAPPGGIPLSITVDTVTPPNGTITIPEGTIIPTGPMTPIIFTVTGLLHSNPNLICPVPN